MIGKRGRKSAGDLQAAKVIEGAFGRRPDPPDDLTERQAALWREVVASEPAEFISTAALRGLLADYCRHREAVESISGIIDSFKPEWLKNAEGAKRYGDLLKMRALETTAAARMATKLRLTNQSRYTPQHAAAVVKNTARAAKPWEN